jgi:hypothetical protein
MSEEDVPPGDRLLLDVLERIALALEVGAGLRPRAGRSAAAELAEQRARAVVRACLAGEVATWDELKREVGGKTSIFTAALKIAVREGWVEHAKRDSRRVGYQITERGRATAAIDSSSSALDRE